MRNLSIWSIGIWWFPQLWILYLTTAKTFHLFRYTDWNACQQTQRFPGMFFRGKSLYSKVFVQNPKSLFMGFMNQVSIFYIRTITLLKCWIAMDFVIGKKEIMRASDFIWDRILRNIEIKCLYYKYVQIFCESIDY